MPPPPIAPAQGFVCRPAGEAGEAGACSVAGDPAAALTRSAIPYFLFNPLPTFHPCATCSPCLSRKLFAVEAVAFASERETEEGSLRKEEAVLRAACFWAKEVPCDGVEGVLVGAGAGEVEAERLPIRVERAVREGLFAERLAG